MQRDTRDQEMQERLVLAYASRDAAERSACLPPKLYHKHLSLSEQVRFQFLVNQCFVLPVLLFCARIVLFVLICSLVLHLFFRILSIAEGRGGGGEGADFCGR